MKIAILGAGAYGTALGGVLADNGYDIDYYDTRLERERLAGVLAGARYIILCTPSTTAPHLLPHLPAATPLIVATKGFLAVAPFAKFSDWMVLSGPGYADDIKAAKPTSLTATDQRIVELLSTNFLSFDTTTDRLGVLMCGALKNIYAIGAGLKDLKPGTAQHEQYLKDAAEEMRQILAANSADPHTVDLSCGLGDLRLTCQPPSRNYAYGQAFYRGTTNRPNQTIEGLSAIRRIERGEITIPELSPIINDIMRRVTDLEGIPRSSCQKGDNHATK